MLVQEVLQKTVGHFKKLQLERPRFLAESVLASALNWKRLDLFLKMEYPLSTEELDTLRQWVKRVSGGEPLAYIEKSREFYGINFKVTPAVLIPRNESELLVDYALEFAQENNLENINIADFGCGSGCLGIAVAKNLSTAKLTGFDISQDAISIASENATKELSENQYSFLATDIEQINPQDKFNIILANPPYIDIDDPNISPMVKKFEPHLALFAKDDGLEFYKSWIPKAVSLVKGPGIILFEIGWKQGEKIKTLVENLNTNFTFEIRKDYNGYDRVLKILIS